MSRASRYRRVLWLGCALALGACASGEKSTAPVTATVRPAEGGASVEPAALALPPGPGREILERECLRCHELDALTLFSDFYGRAQWRALILTMRDNGAVLDDGQVDVLSVYLARHFGTEDS